MSGPRLPRGAVRSPNIWDHPDVYEIENRAADPHGRLEAAMRELGDWSGRTLLDLGCGTGFHLPRWAAEPGAAARVVGVEPHPDLLALARRRVRRRVADPARVSLLPGTAQDVPLPDGAVDVVHVRWAYFFGPGCEPGLRELQRVVRRGGVAFVIDNDGSRSTFGHWFRRGFPHLPEPSTIERFWARHGWSRRQIDMGWRFERPEDLEAVVRLELPPAAAEQALAEHAAHGEQAGAGGLEVDYAVNLWWRTF
ncbi:class I SAM-dependent methyltransferase [Nocardioides sp. TRM66260-LWL]|uniref:class I SAM-dependent methyltransferase n=1 Tax=Nocardioides sp. TRM66260-LWL TaxID=2874478 RepID=UPI001CC75BD4|nr:class I SAM-dependent methyltransferase [Nocardioides sp. TRM66260-LWL]MBZ5734868.1 class I SAM-dependent methyltransferase [Nocardioides sp. TRM66260-LWL]